VTFQQPAPFKPPPGFENSSIDDSLKASKLLKKSNLEGKQIWYITAPASVSISSIEKISLQDIKDGKPILLHEGNNYGFAQDIAQDKTYRNIMAPSESNDGYCTGKYISPILKFSVANSQVPKPIDQLLHLQRVIDLPGASTDPNFTSARATVPAKKPVRPQPKGLQMRFLPIGFGSGNAGRIGSGSSDESGSTESTSDEEVEDGPAKPQRPTSSAPVESGSSSDSSEDESSSESDVEMTDAPILPSKSAIKPKSGEEIPITTGGLKRKHGEGSDIKSKQSSSKSTFSTDDRLKRMKTKQNESQIAGSQSVSTKAPKPKVSQTPTLPSTIHPPKTPQFPQPSSSALPPPSVPRTGVKSTPIRPSSQVVRPISSAARPVSTPSKSDDKPPSRDSKTKLSLEDQIKAIDPNLTAEERNQEARRLRRNESSRISKAKARDSLPKLVDEGKGSEAVKSSPAILPSRHLSPISQAIDNSIAQSQSTTIPAKNSREKKDKKKRKRESE